MLKQDAIYWSPAAPDGFNRISFAAPVEIKVRWEQKKELFIDSTGKEVQSNAKVFVDRVLEEQGYLFLGLLADLDSAAVTTDPQTIDEAWIIRNYAEIPSVDNTDTLRRCFL